MTTNAGAADMARPSIGFMQSENVSDGMEAIRRLFSPEFRNRIDAIIQFGPLSKVTIERVVDKLLMETETQLEQKGVQFSIDDAARGWLADHGYDPKMGAARWPASSRIRSSARWPKNCCSASSPTAAR